LPFYEKGSFLYVVYPKKPEKSRCVMAERINLGKLREVLAVPNLINIQVESYKDFLQKDVPQKDVSFRGCMRF